MLKSSVKFLAICGVSSILIASCSQSVSQVTSQKDWSMQVGQDTCSVSRIVEKYLETNAQAGAETSLGSILSQDKNAILRLRYFGRDRHLLQHITTHPGFAFIPNCVSEFNAVPLVDGEEFGSIEIYQIYSSASADLCRSVPYETNIRGIATKGEARTCFNIDSSESTFEVIEQ